MIIRKINLKKPKYILPLILLIPILFIGYQLGEIFSYEIQDEEKQTETKGEMNTEIPSPNMEQMEMKSKYQNMVDDYSRVRDHSAIQNLDAEEIEENVDGIQNSLYSEKDISLLDSLEADKNKNIKNLTILQDVMNKDSNIPTKRDSISENETENDEFLKQIESMRKIAAGEEIKTPEQIAMEAAKAEILAEQAAKAKVEAEIKAKAEAPNPVIKADEINRKHFNTIGKEAEGNHLIKAMIDEKIKVVNGSRIRIRLLDDVIINDIPIRKGTYIYALISGFGNQRVRANISSILVGDQHIKVALAIYDNDGIEGLYVPSSAFRDLAKDAGSQAMGQSVTMNSNTGEQSLESIAMQTLQGVYQSATTAISNNIKKNKAKLKYSTTVYLINEE